MFKSILVVVLSLLAVSTTVAAASREKAAVLRVCQKEFGPAVDPKANLFAVNRFYVLRVEFKSNGRLKELAVEPKYFFEESHPQWAEPNDFVWLSKLEYEGLLVRLERIKPKGRMIKSAAPLSYVTNMTAHHTQVYQNAVLTWGERVDLRRDANAQLEVRWLRLSFLRSRNLSAWSGLAVTGLVC